MFQGEVRKLLAKDPTHRASNHLTESRIAVIIDDNMKAVLKQHALERLKKLKEADAELVSSSDDEVELLRSILPLTPTPRKTCDGNGDTICASSSLKTKASEKPARQKSRKCIQHSAQRKSMMADEEGML